MDKKVILYSTPTCPKCKVIEIKLSQLGYEVERHMDIEELESLGLRSVPWVKYNDEPLMDFGTATKWIKSLGGSA